MATKITSGSIFSAGAVVVGVDADAPPAVPSPSPEPAPIDVESYLGAPDFSLEDTAPDTFLATPWENTSNGYTGSGAFIAIDTTIDVNNSGVLFEIGGAQSGIGFAQDGNEFSYGVCKGNSTLHNMTTDVSSYNGQTGTFYLTGIRQSNGGTYPEIALYWQEGGSGSTNAPILLGNQSFINAGHDFYWGSSAGGYGQVYESSRALPTLQNYSGTLTGLRIWKDYTTIELPSTSPSPEPAPEPAPATAQILPLSRAVSLLMDASATADGSVVDSSTNSHPITVNGDVSQSSFSPYRSGGYSWGFDGSGDYISIADHDDFNFSSGDFTVEMWINAATQSTNWPGIFSGSDYNAAGSASLRFDNVGHDNKLFLYTNGLGDPALTTTNTLSHNTWHHIALVRSGTSLSFYVNGTQDGTATISSGQTFDFSVGEFRIGRGFDVDGGNAYFAGQIADVRAIKGSATYIADFTPPTERLTEVAGTSLLTCNLPYLQSGLTAHGDVSPVAAGPYDYAGYSESLHGGSIVFDGNGDYLSVDLGADLIASNTQFTAEFWMYPKNISNRGALHFTNNQGTLETTLYISGAGNLSWFDARVGSAAAGDITPNSGGGITTNEWHHIALTRQSDNYVRIYVDGQLYNTSSNVWDLGLSRYLEIGRYANTAYFDGYISDLRIVKGTAVYTTDFTPSTAPLTAVAGTSLLLSGNNASIRDESQSVESISVFGNTTVADSSPYGTGKSMTFDGNGDYLDIDGNSSLEFGSSDFTIELWLNINSVGLYAITDPRTSGSSLSPLIWTKSTGELYYYTAGGDRIVGSTQLNVNTWYHVALSKYNGTTTLYLNGSSEGSFSDSYTYEQPTNFRIGRRYIPNNQNNSFDLNGKIADLRIVKGTAVYTENFTVPSAPLGDYTEE